MPPMFSIEHIEIRGDVNLSPMAGVSDSPYRRLARAMGAGFSFSEFVSADLLRARDPRALAMFRFVSAERPVIFQIFGNDVETVREAALVALELQPDVIDLNMGCSAKHISHKGCGAGLLREPAKAGRMIAELRRVLPIPVTAKIRLGWDERSRNYLETARILEDNGAAMISVHGRTKAQAYQGRADWDAIGEIKARAGVPVLGNGDVTSHAEARARQRETGVDGVLVGRAALGNPWLFGGSHRDAVAPAEILDVLLAHFDDMLAYYEMPHGLHMFRKHARAYLQPFALDAAERRALLTTESPAQFRALIEALRGQTMDPGSRAA